MKIKLGVFGVLAWISIQTAALGADKDFELNAWRGCGFGGVRWHADYKVHLDWCRRVDNATQFTEYKARKDALATCR